MAETVYHYHRKTGVYIGPALLGESVPDFATLQLPPVPGPDTQAVFDVASETWSLQSTLKVDKNIVEAPATLFGGPTMRECFDAQQ